MASFGSFSSLIVLVLLGLCVTLTWTETLADPVPTQVDNQDPLSGGGAIDVTTKDPYADEYDDSTHMPTVDEDEGVLGPGAITAIVIAVFLGASVLLALIVITLRKFTAS
ncbi:protein SNORC [Denticeps clupeoides]|uniref:Protein SNORC n=1 Tax=Denticeps clupeoides TaxID=299321 RepID=A0AAY4EXI9_9TELE|nr:protein SNORC [Denticeps clupeoides]